MSKNKKKRSKQSSKPRRRPIIPVALACLAGLALLSYLTGWPFIGGVDYQTLQGKWLRVDGRYVIEIRSVADDGKMDAAYFNPNPINVSKARATRSDETVKVSIELQDVNYPGSTYTLSFDPREDVLEGIYFQAVQKQQFPVRFIRME
jgi:hypothetical protein